jgi:hypothetical protein
LRDRQKNGGGAMTVHFPIVKDGAVLSLAQIFFEAGRGFMREAHDVATDHPDQAEVLVCCAADAFSTARRGSTKPRRYGRRCNDEKNCRHSFSGNGAVSGTGAR